MEKVRLIEFDWGLIPESDRGIFWWFTIGLEYRDGISDDEDVYWVVSMN